MEKTASQFLLESYCKILISTFDEIPKPRQDLLRGLGAYIAEKVKQQKNIKLVVICTHNSRRSHIGQLWLLTAAQWYGIPNMDTFSGGTEATAFHKNAINALQRSGIQIEPETEGENPIYRATIHIKEPLSKTLFSKTFNSPPNPERDFAAIMVCSEADEECPFVPGADSRFAIPFEDPKNFDATEKEVEEYDKSVCQIGREFFYSVHHASELLNQ